VALNGRALDELRERVIEAPTDHELRIRFAIALIVAGQFEEAGLHLLLLKERRRNDRLVRRLRLVIELRARPAQVSLLRSIEKTLPGLAKSSRELFLAKALAKFGPRSEGRRPMMGKDTSGSVLLWGPPGCGMQRRTRAFAERRGETLIVLDLLRLGRECGHNAADVFEVATDALKTKRDAVVFLSGLGELLSMDGLSALERHKIGIAMRGLLRDLPQCWGLLLVAATSVPWALDETMIWLFDEHRFTRPPDLASRVGVLTQLLDGRARIEDLVETAQRTDGWSAADLGSLCKEAIAATKAGRRVRRRALRAARAAIAPAAPAWLRTASAQAAAARRDGFYNQLFGYLDSRSSAA